MKKFLCLALCLALMLTSATALAAEYTLAEKWQRQVAFGNGVKGTISMSISGETDWAQLLSPLDGAELEVRAIQKDGRKQYRLYALKGEEVVGLTRLFSQDNELYLASDLLPDMILRLSTGGDLINLLTGGQEGNAPNWYSAALRLMDIPETTWTEKWTPVLARYEKKLELWLETFASAPSVKREGDAATVLARYDVPAEGLKAQMKMLWQEMMADAELQELMQGQLTPEQQQAYMSPGLQWYYDGLIDSLNLGDGIVLEREMSTRGEVVSSTVTLPLEHMPGGWTALKFLQHEKETTLRLEGAETSLSITLSQTVTTANSTAWSGVFRYVNGKDLPLAVSFNLVKIATSSVDADGRSHQVTSWSLKAEQSTEEETACQEVQPFAVDLLVHMNSRNAQINPVNLEIGLTVKLAQAAVEAKVSLTTHSPWVLDDLPVGKEMDLADMSEEKRGQVFADLGRNALVTLMGIKGDAAEQEAEQPIPTLEPAPSFVPETAPTEVPTDKPTEDPAETVTEKPTESLESVEESTEEPTEEPTEVGLEPTQTPDAA